MLSNRIDDSLAGSPTSHDDGRKCSSFRFLESCLVARYGNVDVFGEAVSETVCFRERSAALEYGHFFFLAFKKHFQRSAYPIIFSR
jgi:hypothetical protein